MSILYWVCSVNNKPTDILEEQVLEDIDPNMNEEDGIKRQTVGSSTVGMFSRMMKKMVRLMS